VRKGKGEGKRKGEDRGNGRGSGGVDIALPTCSLVYATPLLLHQAQFGLSPLRALPLLTPLVLIGTYSVHCSGGFTGGRAGFAALPLGHSAVKHALQNTHNDCHQWLSHSFRVRQIRFQPLGELTAVPQTP